MYFCNMFRNGFVIYFGFYLLFLSSACQDQSKAKQSEDSSYEVVIQHAAGDDYLYSHLETPIAYLNYPFNMGYISGLEVDNVQCILLSKQMSPRSRIAIKPIAVFKTKEHGEGINYIIAIPTDPDLKSVTIDHFSDLVTKHIAVKSIIEFWILNRCGMGCAENVSWGNENSAAFVLEQLIES